MHGTAHGEQDSIEAVWQAIRIAVWHHLLGIPNLSRTVKTPWQPQLLLSWDISLTRD